MEESVTKGMKSLELNDSIAVSRESDWSSSISTISVEGYDTGLQPYALKLALTKHFSSCGEMRYIHVPRDYEKGFLESVAIMRIAGEDVERKALALNGSDVGGWNAIVKASPWKRYLNDPCRPYTSPEEHHSIIVTGYDTSLAEIDIQTALCKHFSSCGEVTQILIHHSGRAFIDITGKKRCLNKALELSGCNMGGKSLLVQCPQDIKEVERKGVRPKSSLQVTGYTIPSCLLTAAKRKQMELLMEMEKVTDVKKKKKMRRENDKLTKEVMKLDKKVMEINERKKKKMEMETLEMALS